MTTRLLCQYCQFREKQDMLTTYSLTQCQCDGCGRVRDLAITIKPTAYQQWGTRRIKLNWGTQCTAHKS